MSCASKAVSEAAARMRSAGEQANKDSVAGVYSPDATNMQPATSDVAGARVLPRAALSSVAFHAGGCSIYVDSENKYVYLG